MLPRPRESNRWIDSLFFTSSKGEFSEPSGESRTNFATCQAPVAPTADKDGMVRRWHEYSTMDYPLQDRRGNNL